MNELEKSRQELYHAAIHYGSMVTTDGSEIADEDRTISVIFRLELAAEKFVEAKNKTLTDLQK